jgi:hypothetical protein
LCVERERDGVRVRQIEEEEREKEQGMKRDVRDRGIAIKKEKKDR